MTSSLHTHCLRAVQASQEESEAIWEAIIKRFGEVALVEWASTPPNIEAAFETSRKGGNVETMVNALPLPMQLKLLLQTPEGETNAEQLWQENIAEYCLAAITSAVERMGHDEQYRLFIKVVYCEVTRFGYSRARLLTWFADTTPHCFAPILRSAVANASICFNDVHESETLLVNSLKDIIDANERLRL